MIHDLATFLTARLDEELDAVKIAQNAGLDDTWGEWPEPLRWNRMLADIDAKRRIIGHAEVAHERAKIGPSEGDSAWFLVLRYLALPYADHPAYDQAWRP